MKLLLCDDTTVSFGAKQSIIRVLRPKVRKTRKVHIPTPPGADLPRPPSSHARKPTIASLSSINSSLGKNNNVVSIFNIFNLFTLKDLKEAWKHPKKFS